jgi:hypothetical protein
LSRLVKPSGYQSWLWRVVWRQRGIFYKT